MIAFTLYFFYVYSSDFIGIKNPRLAYQNHRAGYGHLWAGYIFFLSLWVLVRINNKSNFTVTIIVYLIGAYQSGSKGLLISSVLPFIAFGYYENKFFKLTFYIILMAIIYLVLNLFNAFDDFSLIFKRVESYFDMFNNSSRIFKDYLDNEFEFQKGSIYLSSFWQYVPRFIYPDKPYVWGTSSLVEIYYPGIAIRGTPSFGLYMSEFADFGYYGIILVLLKIENILTYLSLFILSRNIYSNKIQLFCAAILILPGFNFHVPLLIGTLIFFIVVVKK